MLAMAFVLSGCASKAPTEAGAGARSVAFVQHGTEPLDYSTGVIDASSFWAVYGDDVARRLGGIEAFNELAKDGRSAQEYYAEQNHYLVDILYDRHDLADNVAKQLMPELAAAFGVAYRPAELVVLDENVVFLDPDSLRLRGFDTEAELILMIDVAEINLTERFSAGSALANGVTFGTNQKKLTVQSPTNLRAFRRPTPDEDPELVWSHRCGADYTSMKTAFTLEELMLEPAKMEAVLDEARDQTIGRCSNAMHRMK